MAAGAQRQTKGETDHARARKSPESRVIAVIGGKMTADSRIRARGSDMPSALWQEQNAFKANNVVRRCGAQRQKINDPPVSLPRRFRVEPVDQFFSCQVLQLLTLEAAAWKRLPEGWEIACPDVAFSEWEPVTNRVFLGGQ
jgi:hypothetical protein